MQIETHIDIETLEHLGKQSRLLLRIYQAELAKDPTSPATERSRSNMIAVQDSISQIYGAAAALEVANSLGSVNDAIRTDE